MSRSIDLETRYCAHNYHPLPVVLTRGEGVFVWDEDGREFVDLLTPIDGATVTPLPDPTPTINAGHIRQLRELRELTMQQAADRAGLSRQGWHLVETGRRTDPSVTTLQRIARALDVEPAELLLPLADDDAAGA